MNRTPQTTTPWTRLLLAIAAGMLVAATATATASERFGRSSLSGTYAYTGEGSAGDDRALTVGTIGFDGAGNLTRNLTLNAPAEGGGRSLLQLESVGTYGVRGDGTGRFHIVNELSDGSSNVVTVDFVVKRSRDGASGPHEVLKLFGVQRQPGITVDLVTATVTRGSP
ncbi:MAG: hypothetical protein VYE73_05780 [Acidobacteriota bacterium]|nr:hypothetical protein [Acidobacteriota bacterium]